MKYKALFGFRYADRILNKDDLFEAPEAHGQVLVALGRAEIHTPAKSLPKAKRKVRKPHKDKE